MAHGGQHLQDCESPCSLVNQGWQLSQSYASQAFNTANTFFADISPLINGIADIPPVNLNVNFPSPNFSPINLPSAPQAPNLAFTAPSDPGDVSVDNVSKINPTAPPQFLAQFPTLTLPTRPQPLDVTAPGAPGPVAEIEHPERPDYDLPLVPTLRELNIPDPPAVEDISFTDDKPTANIGIPTGAFNYTEQMYDSTLLSAVNTKLLDDIQNGRLGLPAPIEIAIWDRARSREEANVDRLRAEALDSFAARGFGMPPGALAGRLMQAEQEAVDKGSDLNRDIAIKQAEMTLQHLQFALTTAVQSEGQLITYAGFMAQRAWDTQKAILDASIAIFNARIQKFQSDVQAYATFAQVFKTRVDAELAKMERFRLQLEAQKAIGDINRQDIDLYVAQLGAIRNIVDIYRTETEATRNKVSIENLKLEQHRTQVETFATQVRAKGQEYNGYATALQGELAKVQIFDTQTRAYSAQVEGYRGLLQAQAIRTESDIAVNRGKIDVFRAKVQAFQARLAAELGRLQAMTQAHSANVQGYSAQVGAEGVRVQSEQATLQIQSENARSETQLRLQESIAEIQRAQKSVELLLESLRSGATVASSLASSALSAVNLSGYISGSDSTTTSFNYQF